MNYSTERSMWASSRVAAAKQGAGTLSSHANSPSSSLNSHPARGTAASNSRTHLSGSSTSAWASPASQPSSALPNLSMPAANGQGAASRSSPYSANASNASRYAPGNRQTSSAHGTSLLEAPAPRQRDLTRQLGGSLDPMSLIASPSRGIQSAHSTSLGASSEQDLTNHQTQENFRGYVSRRIAAHCQRFPTLTLAEIARKIAVPGDAAEEADAKRREEIDMARVSLEEILLLVRKLREGVMASHRMDAATIEVYQLSLFLSVHTLNSGQLSSTINRLVLDLFPNIPCKSSTTSTWPGNVFADFTSTPEGSKEDAFVAQLRHFAEDTPATRAHHASLLLLSHTCLGSGGKSGMGGFGSAGGLQDNFFTLKHKVLAALGLSLEDTPNADIVFAEQADRALRTGDVLLFRKLLSHRRASVWQKLLLEQAVPKMRAQAWTQLKKAYMSVPLPLSLSSQQQDGEPQGEQWLEEVLLIDTHLVPVSNATASSSKTAPQAAPTKKSQTKILDSWDEADLSQLDLASASAPATPAQEEERRTRIARLAGAFTHHALPSSQQQQQQQQASKGEHHTTTTTATLAQALAPWKERLVLTKEGERVCAIKLR
ncbi:hypothetical protein BCV69DRAFT_297729 [Microstroma glucosiphilum]|uniref:Uncharacterized protein n=1 Tax=Pseudomicrostroma glucosiphilum TaxID=1684307 RepID=A0A316UC40_9BASI|nr:hypothetical protein BCV69DRAFT_297729 [Pseudomicrostroma glucosiphilum]PWN22438.1 hypothetical protein BCV69DRAFT_297729 [Pseudomicrostroma glucosiphilum]